MQLEQLINNMLTMFMMKSDTIRLTDLIYPTFIIGITKLAQFLQPHVVAYINNKTKEVVKRTVHSSTPCSPSIQSYISFERDYSQNTKEMEVVDAVIGWISKNDKVKRLMYRDSYIFEMYDKVEIEPHIFVKLDSIAQKGSGGSDKDSVGAVCNIRFHIFSYTLTLTELRAWVGRCTENYTYIRTFGLQDKQFFFLQNPSQYEQRQFIFTQSPFYTTKTMDNLVGEYIEKVKERLNIFLDEPEWYTKNGLPHSFGLLLSGPPGTGKTSIIKAIANRTKRHIFSIKLTKETRSSQLRNLFINDEILVGKQNNSQPTYLNIPMSKRIIIFEDIDSSSNVLLSREHQKEDVARSHEDNRLRDIIGDDRMKQLQKDDDKLTLQDMLNLLDGILEQPGRIVIFTSNYPDRLDPAFLRPGRIDMNIRFGNCSSNTIRQLFERYYKCTEINFDFTPFHNLLSPALVQELILQNLFNPQHAYDALQRQLEI